MQENVCFFKKTFNIIDIGTVSPRANVGIRDEVKKQLLNVQKSTFSLVNFFFPTKIDNSLH